MKWFGCNSAQSVASENHHRVSKCDKNRHMERGYISTFTSTFLCVTLTIFFCSKTCYGMGEIIGVGTFSAAFVLYEDSSYRYQYQANENPRFQMNEMLYMEIQLQLERPSSAGLVILAEECAGVPVEGGDQKFDLITDGCKSPTDPYRGEILNNGNDFRARFTHITFMFHRSAATVIQCKIRLCTKNCEPTCPADSRRRRDVTNNNNTLTTAGITINVIPPTETDSSAPTIDSQLLWLGGFIILALLLLVAIAIFVFTFLRKQRFRLHSDVTKRVPVHEITICKGDF